ncbi:MAG: hypothetical protein JF571_01735 [Asticcacaulis sp.]|nr:hypothetical protein [Asticcacaulis sp.]
MSGFGRLVVFLSMMKPAFSAPSGKRRGSYHKASDTYYANCSLIYDDWISGSWAERIDSYARSVTEAVQRIAKTRIRNEERDVLFDVVNLAAIKARTGVPSKIEALESIFVTRDASGNIVCKGGLPLGDAHALMGYSVEEVLPGTYLPADKAPEEPPMFKLYRRGEDGLHYYEAWANGDEIVEHRGVCGTEGETRNYPYATLAQAHKICAASKAAGRAENYRPLALSKHRRLVVELPIDGFGDATDIDTRHTLEDFLDNRLGWLGLGHCDGGSTGSGTMEVFCFVVDMAVAREAVARELAGLDLPAEPRIYEMT